MVNLKIPERHQDNKMNLSFDNIDSAKHELGEKFKDGKIILPMQFPTFDDFFERLNARIREEGVLHNIVMEEQKTIVAVFEDFCKSIFKQCCKLNGENDIPYNAINFLQIFSNGELNGQDEFQIALEELVKYLNTKYPIKTPLNANKVGIVNTEPFEKDLAEMISCAIMDNAHLSSEEKIKKLEQYFINKMDSHYQQTNLKMKKLTTRLLNKIKMFKQKNKVLKNKIKVQGKKIEWLKKKAASISELSDNNMKWNPAKLISKKMSLQETVDRLNLINELKHSQCLKIMLDFNKLKQPGLVSDETLNLLQMIQKSTPFASTSNTKITIIVKTSNPKLTENHCNEISKLKDKGKLQFHFDASDQEITDAKMNSLSQTLCYMKTLHKIYINFK